MAGKNGIVSPTAGGFYHPPRIHARWAKPPRESSMEATWVATFLGRSPRRSGTFLSARSWRIWDTLQKDKGKKTGWWLSHVEPTPLKNDGVRQLGLWHAQLNGKIKFMFQTTNEVWFVYPHWSSLTMKHAHSQSSQKELEGRKNAVFDYQNPQHWTG